MLLLVKQCMHVTAQCPFCCCHSHCCRTIFAPMSHCTARIRTFDVRTLVSFALLTLSHCWHSHWWLRTGVVRTFVFRTLVVQALNAPVPPRDTAKALMISIVSTSKSRWGRPRTARDHTPEITVKGGGGTFNCDDAQPFCALPSAEFSEQEAKIVAMVACHGGP